MVSDGSLGRLGKSVFLGKCEWLLELFEAVGAGATVSSYSH